MSATTYAGELNIGSATSVQFDAQAKRLTRCPICESSQFSHAYSAPTTRQMKLKDRGPSLNAGAAAISS